MSYILSFDEILDSTYRGKTVRIQNLSDKLDNPKYITGVVQDVDWEEVQFEDDFAVIFYFIINGLKYQIIPNMDVFIIEDA